MMSILKVVVYTISMYIYLILIIRLMGKREIGSLSVFDLAVYFTISDLITISIVDHTIPIYLTIISVALLCGLQIVLAFVTLKNKKIREFIDGKSSLIINDGIIDFEEMKKQRYTIDDLFNQLRDKGYDSPTLIRWAILENSGKLSVISYEDSIANYPDPIISDGCINYDALKKIKKDEQWLLQQLYQTNVKKVQEVTLCLYIRNQLTFIFKTNKGK